MKAQAMYQLYWAPGTAAMAPQTVLEEIGVPYELIRLDTAAKQHHSPEYRRLNPNAKIPTLIDGNLVLFETAAICLYLADKHQAAGLVPPAGTPERGRFYQWLVYLTNTVQEGFVQWYHPDWHADSEAGRTEVKAASERRLYAMWDILDRALAATPYLAGERYSIADLYLTMLVRWSRAMPRPAWEWPSIRRLADGVHRRPPFQRMMQKQGIAWPENWPR
jgi:glutathione S-transferase